MRKRTIAILAVVAAIASFVAANADVNYTAGSGTVIFAFTCFSTKVCPAHTPVDTAGATLVGAAGSPTSNSLTTQAATLGNGTSANAARVTISNDSTGQVNTLATVGTPVTMQNGATANGNGSTLTTTGFETVLLNVNCSVACTGGTTINFEGTDSTGTYFSIAGIPVAAVNSASVSTATTSGQFWVPVAGLTTVRARISAYSAGTITVTGTPANGYNGSLTGAAQIGTWTNRIVGNAGNNLDFAGQNASGTVNAQLTGCMFVTSPTTITSTNFSPEQCDNVGNRLVAANDGKLATVGAQADAAWVSGSGSLIAISKTIANNTGASVPAGTNIIGFTSNDPCSQLTKSGAAINLTGSGQVITGTAAKKTYICAINLVSATTQNIALVEGTGSTCATNIFGLAGGTTAATGWNLIANGGLTLATNGTVISPSADTNATAANVCLLLSGTGQTSGQIAYVQQ